MNHSPTACCSQEYESMRDLLSINEGWKNKAYYDHKGHLTIGCGHLLVMKGQTSVPQSAKNKITNLGASWAGICNGTETLDDSQVEQLLENDLEHFITQCEDSIDVYNDAPGCVQMVLLDMCFNMGLGNLLKFKKMLSNIRNVLEGTGDKEDVIAEMEDSKWYRETGHRPKRLITMIRNCDNF